MAERRVQVLAVAGGELQLRLLGSACEGCVGGCGGRCNLFAGDADQVFHLAAPSVGDFRVGQHLRLQLDDAGLRRAAWRGYGRVWLGLLAGAGLGAAIGAFWGRHADLLTLLGLLLGTFSAARFSKRHLPEPRVAAVVPESLSPLSTSDRP
jgi:hypothetical protein